MTDAELIYNALLRAERRAHETMNKLKTESPADLQSGAAVYLATRMIREEIRNGLAARQTPAGLDAISGKGG